MKKLNFTITGNVTQTNASADHKIEWQGEGTVDAKKEQKDNCWFCSMVKSKWFLMGIIIILLGWIVFLHFYTVTDINNVTLILAFVGILVTFVVISNYVQVRDVKEAFENKINVVDERGTRIIKIENKVEILEKNVNEIKKIEEDFYSHYMHFLYELINLEYKLLLHEKKDIEFILRIATSLVRHHTENISKYFLEKNSENIGVEINTLVLTINEILKYTGEIFAIKPKTDMYTYKSQLIQSLYYLRGIFDEEEISTKFVKYYNKHHSTPISENHVQEQLDKFINTIEKTTN
jgi:hypothetical protein